MGARCLWSWAVNQRNGVLCKKTLEFLLEKGISKDEPVKGRDTVRSSQFL